MMASAVKAPVKTVHESSEEESDGSHEVKSKPAKQKEPERTTNTQWSRSEEETVFKRYGLVTALPRIWTDEPAYIPHTEENINAKQTLFDVDPYADTLGVLGKRISRGMVAANPLLNIADRKFDPKTYLSLIHQNTSYKDLKLGALNLKATIGSREDSLKSLIKAQSI